MRFIILLISLLVFISCSTNKNKTFDDCTNMKVLDNIDNLVTDIESDLFHERVEFIYKGKDKIQCLDEDIIKNDKVAILRGKVLNEENETIKGVKVTVNNYPE